MSAEYATFGLAPAMRTGGVLANGDRQVHRDFIDFVVDGRPLLFRLPDLDAVSPLACDLPPAVLTAQVRALLLETGAPLAGGRHIIYGCPECADLACGAVTAVIENDGDDVVWRDFVRQSDERVDLELNGCPGTGPFRFHGEEYRRALRALLDGGAAERSRVLLIGPRVAGPARLAAALRTIGIGADITQDATDVLAEELRGYGAVVFGDAVGERERAGVRDSFERAGVEVAYVDGPAPVVPLLVAQVEQALDRNPPQRRRLVRLTAADGTADLEVGATCRVGLTTYRLDRLHRVHIREVFDGMLATGRHRIALGPRATRGEAHVVARTSAGVLVAAVAS